jgi:hypothetical protein
VHDIHGTLGIPQPKASRHLKYLKRRGLVLGRQQGLWVHYQIAPMADPVMKALMGVVTHCLSHVEVVGRDRQRLDANTGNCGPARPSPPVFECCRGGRQSAADRRRAADRRGAPRSTR